MTDDLGERTEEATPRRRQEARNEGQVARSQDLAAAVVLAATTAALAAAGLWMLAGGRDLMLDALTFAGPDLRTDGLRAFALRLGLAGAALAAPVLVVGWLGGVIAHVGQFGLVVAPKVLSPDPSKLDPVKGFQRIFGISGVVKAALDAGKVTALVAVAAYTVREQADALLGLPRLDALGALRVAAGVLGTLAWRLLAVLLLLGLLDFAYQRWKRGRDLRMTKQQVRDELKQTEGDPEIRRRRQRLQQQMALQRIGAAVPTADVIVTNPEHVAVAIRYDETAMHAPRVVAKGAELLALRIRQLAAQAGVPVVERKPLARALYRDVPVGGEIPPDLYSAVAEVLAYVYRMEGRFAG